MYYIALYSQYRVGYHISLEFRGKIQAGDTFLEVTSIYGIFTAITLDEIINRVSVKKENKGIKICAQRVL